jgi:hypothetical protein
MFDSSNNPVNDITTIDALLEREKQHNKTETWTKLDKTVKLQKLLAYAEKYGKDNHLSDPEMRKLNQFFSECLEKNKLQKTKEIVYNKETKEITNIPSLHFHTTNRNFTLKVMDAKRVSTIKSLTPKRTVTVVNTDRNKSESVKPPINISESIEP